MKKNKEILYLCTSHSCIDVRQTIIIADIVMNEFPRMWLFGRCRQVLGLCPMGFIVCDNHATSVILLKRAFSFIAKITTFVRKYHRAADQKTKLQLLLTPATVPTFIQKLIQRE